MFVETINSYNDNTITNNNKDLFQLQRFNKESNQIDPSFYEGYIVGERPNAINNRKYANPIIYSIERLAQIAAQSIKRPYQVQQGNRQKITKVRFRADDIVFNPMLLGNNVTISYQPDLRTGYIEPLQKALNKTYGNKPYLLVNDDVFLDSRKISETFIDVAPVTNKYKLRETNARLTKETKENLETQSGAPTLEGYFRQLYGSTNRIPINIRRFLTVGRGNGSEYIAPLMDFGSEAFIQSDIFKSDLSMFEKMKENLLYGPFEYPKDLTVEEAQQIYDAINIVTEQSIALFPDEILVYRGSDISKEFNLIPVTVSKSIAEAFGKNRTRREDRIERQYYNRKLEEEGISLLEFKAQVESLAASPRDIAKYGFNVKKFLLPKEAIAANMEALYRGSSMFPYNPVFNVFNNAYNFKGEAELLIPKQFLIDPETSTNLGKEVITTHLSSVASELQERIILQKRFEEDTEISPKPTLTQKELTEARQDLFRLATQPKFQRENISIDDIYELVLHPAMLATQQEAIYISDVYDNLTASQLEKRIDNMADDAVKTAADYAGGNLKYEKKAVIIIGPPGAGKSTFAEDIAARKGYAIVDADDIKKQMPEFKNGIGANATHKFSKILAASLNRQFISEGANLIIPKVTGRAKQKTGLYKTKRFIKDLINSGYKVDIVYPDADINQAIVRNVTRFAETGRFVNLDYLLSIDNSVRDTYNLLKEIAKEEPTFKNVGFAYINNNYKIGEEIVEEDTTELFQDDRIVDENRIRSRGGREKTLREEEITEQNNALLRIAEEQKQNSIAAGVTPVINTNASPNAVATAVKTQQEIKNSPAENNADVNTILADIPNETKIKYSFNKSNKPLNKNAEELIENLTVRDDTIENKTTGQLVLEGFKSVDPLAFREGFLDQYARLAETDYKAGRKNKYGDKMLLASMSAGAALYFSDRSGDIFQQAFLRGVPVYDKDKGYTYVTNISPIDNKPITPFFDVFKPAYENPNLLWAFQSVMRVKRETRFNREGRKVKVTAADRKKAKQVLQDYPELQTMIDEYNRTNEHTVQFLVDTGVLDEQTGKTWLENADYIPFYRPLEGVEGFKGPQIFQGLSVTPFQRAKGSEEKDIVDPITGITNNLRAAINLGMKNIAANRVMRNFVDMGIAQKVKGNVKGPDIVTIRVKGKNVNFKVDDPMLYQSFSVMNQGDFAPQGLFMSILRGTKGFVSDLITRVPDFWFRQIVRDSASAYVLSGANYVPIISSIKESMSIAKGMITGRLPEEFVKLRNAGIITGYDKGVRDIDSTESLVNGLYKNAFKSERPLIEKVYMFPIDLLSTVWDILGQGTAITDAATRVAVYKDTLKRTDNEAEAIFQALEVLNFTRRGNNQLFQLYAQSTMFLNPRLQGLDVFYRGLTGRYGIGKGLSRSKRLKAVLMRVSAVASLSVFYYLLARDSEEYEEAPEEIKDNYLIIPGSKKLVGQPVAIPKPFEVGLLTMTIPERLTAYFMDDIAGKDVADSLKRNLSHTLAITPPTAVDPLLENFFNYDFFTGRQIVPDYLKGTGDLAYRPQTDTLSKVIGDELNISPLYVENLFRSYSGTLGSWIMMATDSLIREGLTDAERVKFGIDRLPVVGTFLLPAEGSNFENQFYSMKKDVDDLVKTFRQIEQQAVDKGDLYVLGMLDEYQVGYMDALKNLQSELTRTADQLKEIRNFEAQIVNSTTLSAEEKKAQLDNIRATKNDLLKGIPEQRKFYLEEFRERAVVR
jgi:dephospho-CoA kinase